MSESESEELRNIMKDIEELEAECKVVMGFQEKMAQLDGMADSIAGKIEVRRILTLFYNVFNF